MKASGTFPFVVLAETVALADDASSVGIPASVRF
jgi:hypothetical protein